MGGLLFDYYSVCFLCYYYFGLDGVALLFVIGLYWWLLVYCLLACFDCALGLSCLFGLWCFVAFVWWLLVVACEYFVAGLWVYL